MASDCRELGICPLWRKGNTTRKVNSESQIYEIMLYGLLERGILCDLSNSNIDFKKSQKGTNHQISYKHAFTHWLVYVSGP